MIGHNYIIDKILPILLINYIEFKSIESSTFADQQKMNHNNSHQPVTIRKPCLQRNFGRPIIIKQILTLAASLVALSCLTGSQVVSSQQIPTEGSNETAQLAHFMLGRKLDEAHLDMARDELLNDNENMILKGSTGDYNFEHEKALSDSELNKMSNSDWHPPEWIHVALTEEEKEIIKLRYTRGEERLKLLSIFPRGGPTYGSTKVVVRADGLEDYAEVFPTPKCRFGSNRNIVEGTYIRCTKKPRGFYDRIKDEIKNYTCILCEESPAYYKEEIINFHVSLTGKFDDIYTSLPYRYYEQVIVSGIYPEYGPKDGDTVVQVWGRNFLDLGDDFRCNFGSRSTQAYLINSEALWCRSAVSDVVERGMPFSVSLNRQQNSIENIYYYYYNEPILSKIFPDWGPASGGTKIVLKGSGFMPFDYSSVDNRRDTMCDWGELGKKVAVITSSTEATCFSPVSNNFATEVEVRLTLNNQNVTEPKIFSYYNPPKIVEVEPLRGPEHGGTTVHIYGTRYFRNRNIQCYFGENIVPARYVSYTHITCVAPPADHGPGSVKLYIKYSDDRFSSDTVDFQYFHATHITEGPYPSCGPISGGTQIKLKGEAFQEPGFGLAKCVFNGTYYTNATIYDNTTLYCNTPELIMEDEAETMFYKVYVSLDGENFSDDSVNFNYYDDIEISDVIPWLGPMAGGTDVKVYASHLEHPHICDLSIRFGPIELDQQNISIGSKGYVALQTPPSTIPGTVVVSISGNSQQYSKDLTLHFRDRFNSFEYYQDFFITGVEPPAVSNRGHAEVKVKGMLFDQFQTTPNQTIMCRYMESNNIENQFGIWTEMVRTGENEMKCMAPRTEASGLARLQISPNGQDWQDLNHTIQVFKGPFIREIWPTYVVTRNPQNKSLIVSGDNFVCEHNCNRARVKFKNKLGDEIVMPAQVLKNGSLTCVIPPYTSPEILTVDISFNGQEYTNDNFEFGYLDPYVLDVQPRLVSSHGTTKLTLHGFGMIQMQGARFDAIYKHNNQLTLCPDHRRCQKKCHVKNEHLCTVDTFPQADMTTENHTNIGHQPFHVDIRNPDVDYVPDDVEMVFSKYMGEDTHGYYPMLNMEKPLTLRTNFSWYDGSLWTQYSHSNNFSCHFAQGRDTNYLVLGSAPMEDGQVEFQKRKNLDLWYYKDPDFLNISTTYAYLNEEKPVVINTDFFWDEGNDYYAFRKYANITCRWTSENQPFKQKTTYAMMESIPIGSYQEDMYPSQIRCKTPRWNTFDKLNLQISVNGQDYMSSYSINIVEELKNLRISPMAGPIMGGTNITVWGTGYTVSQPVTVPLYIKFGNLDYYKINKEQVEQAQFYSKDYYYDDLKMHPFRLRPAINRMQKVSEGKTLDRYQYVQTPDLRHYFHRSKNRSDIWIKQRGGPVLVQIGELLTLNVTDQRKANLDTYKKEVPMDMEMGFKLSTTQLQFYYYRQPIVKKVEPLLGLTEGGTPISITGAWFDERPEYGVFPFCRIGGKLGKAKFYSSTRIVCFSPKSTNIDESLRIEVSLNGYDFSDTRYKFNYYEIPTLKDVLPKSGPITGGSNVWLKGERFAALAQASLKKVKCRFTQILPDDATEEQVANHKIKYIPAYPVDNETMKCTTPPGFEGGDQAWVDLTFNGADYTANRVKFDFFAIYGSFPKSGPNDAYNGFIQIRGKGFRDHMKIICNMNNTYVLPLAIHWDVIKCPMIVDLVELKNRRRLEEGRQLAVAIDEDGKPHYSKRFSNIDEDDSDEFDNDGNYRSVPFSIVIDAYQRKFGQFFYYKQITIDNVSPLLAPNEGKGEIYIEGRGFRSDFKSAKMCCRVGNELANAKIIDTSTIKCILKNRLPLLDEGNTLRVSAALNCYSWAESSYSLTPYGIEGLYPNAAPWQKSTNIYITGKGFNNELAGNARCRFGKEGQYTIVDGTVLDNEHMFCHLPVGQIPFPSGAKPEGVEVPFSIAFQDEQFYPYTGGDWTFRLYQQPRLISAEPTVVTAGKTTKIFVKADKSRYFFEPPAPPGQNYNDDNWIRCKFGFLGTMPAVYLNKTTIICVTPAIHDPKDIPVEGVSVELTVAMNGQDYSTQDQDIMVKFIGTDKNDEVIPMIYIIIFLSTILFILLFAAITVFCFGLKKMYIAKSQYSEAQSQRESMRSNVAPPLPQVEEQKNEVSPEPAGRTSPPNDIQIERPDGKMRKFKGFGRKKKD